MKSFLIKIKSAMDEWETSQAFDDAESEQYNHFKSAYQKLVDNQQTNNKREVHENKTTLLKNQKSKQTNGTINSMDISQKINKTTEIVHLNDCPMSEIIIKYGLRILAATGERHQANLFCILIPKNICKVSVYKYIEKLMEINKNTEISIHEDEIGYYVIKNHLKKKSGFKTLQKFEPVKFDDNLTKEKHVFIVENRKYFLSKFKKNECLINDSLASQYMGKLISEKNDEKVKQILEILLKNNYEKLKIKYINEFNCSLVIAIVLFAFSSTQKNSYVYSMEKSMKIGQKIRRCDAIYIHKNLLVIFEFKNNVNKKESPLEYIDDREYVDFTLKYFFKFEPYLIKKMTKIRRIGIEFLDKIKTMMSKFQFVKI